MLFCRQEFASLMSALSGNTLGNITGPGALDLFRNNSRGSSRASTPSPTMGKTFLADRSSGS